MHGDAGAVVVWSDLEDHDALSLSACGKLDERPRQRQINERFGHLKKRKLKKIKMAGGY
jgi:hypothetical protein